MYPAVFEYHRADSIKDALAMLAQYGDDAKLLAGGHSLLPIMKMRLAQPRHLVDISAVADLRRIDEQGGRIVIGAAVRHHEVVESALVQSQLGLLAECAATIGDVQVRNRGTLGGSLSHADPAADYPAAVLALDGEITLASAAGERTVQSADFFVGLMTTALGQAEIMSRVSFAPLAPGTGFAYVKHPQPASGFAIVGVAAVVALNRKGSIETVRVGITGLAAKAFRATAVEAALKGVTPNAKTLADAASHGTAGVEPLSDIHASAEFRAELARVHALEALQRAVARARG